METLRFLGMCLLAVGVFGLSYHYALRLIDWFEAKQTETRDYIQQRLALMFIEIEPKKLMIYMFSGSFGLGGLIFILFLPNLVLSIICGLVVGVLGWKSLRPVVDMLYRRRMSKFVLQLVDALALMSNGLKSGLSVVQAMSLVVEEMPNPVKQEFNLVLNQNKLGVSLEEAFSNLAQRIPAEDVEMFVTAVNILKETGGNLSETFDTIVLTIRERIKVENKISALTAQGFYQGMVVIAVPPLLFLIMYQNDPEFVQPLFTSPIGWAIVLGIILLEIIGFFVIMKVVRIDV
ncbi:MAG: type II secretion system F family protein [Bdellovibrionales bacterium]|nr:type II secretion system F family protein [Bdellovibrionales bacterium]